MYLLWLGHSDAHDSKLVGGKAANLSRLAGDHPVPPGFCLTTAAFEAAHEGSAAVPRLPRAIFDQIGRAYRTLALQTGVRDPSVAVRSSAVDEDGAEDSFAGQHETYLNVSGLAAVTAAVLRCWESAHTPRALAYRRQRGLSAERVRLAVLIQVQVASDVSAVVFSANPLTGRRDEVVINASWGLGESIVGGSVTPDTYTVRRADLAVAGRVIGAKQRMTIATAGGTREVDVPRLLQTQPALSDAQAAEMARLAVSLESRMGWPVDVECAYQGGRLYLLQCRPITTLAPHGASLALAAA
ncbi:MAG: PEP/pyruvate-binding domain-containing protein [Chloroflexota bacterium]